MFYRQLLKKEARKQLKGKMLLSLFITFISLLLVLLFVPVDKESKLFSLMSIMTLAVAGIMTNARIKVFFTYTRNVNRLNFSFNLFLIGLEDWIRGMTAAFVIGIRVMLWSFLFFVPAIVAIYKYSLTFYLLADNKNLGSRKAVRLSAILTRGYKADLFLLHLSFLPLIVLSILTLGIGFLFVVPYIETTMSNAYLLIKSSAIKQRILDIEDFTGK